MLPKVPVLLRRSSLIALFFAAISAGSGCTPSIGDSCSQSTDCSARGDRLCDTSMPGGYCTIFNCENDSCPGSSMCVEFNTNSTIYGDQTDRFVRRFCMAPCTQASDCRAGYTCVTIGNLVNPLPNVDDAVIVDTAPTNNAICLP